MNESFYVGAVGVGGCNAKLSVIANNLANINTSGFKPKASAFSELVNYNLNDSPEAATELQAGAGMRLQRTYSSFDVSGYSQSDSEYDYAISEPNAFFMVQDPVSGETAFTRNGHFFRSEREDGFYLMTGSGKYVLDQNQEPIILEVKDIDKLQAEMEEDYEPEEVEEEDDEEDVDKPTVSLYTFSNPSRLMSAGGQEFVIADEGVEPVLVTNPGIIKGALESSGTDMAKEMAKLIECQRALTYALRMVTTSDEIEATINNLRG